MLRIRFADYAHDALSGNYLTILAALFYRCLYFHCRLSKILLDSGRAGSTDLRGPTAIYTGT